MANEEKKPDSNSALPSVDDLLRAPTDPAAPAPAPSPAALGMTPQSDDEEIIDFDPEMVDQVLEAEDPNFAAELKEIKASEFKTNVAIEAVDIEAFLREGEAIKSQQPAAQKLSLKERFQGGYDRWHAGTSKLIDDFQNGSVAVTKGAGHLLLSFFKNLLKYSLGAVGKFFSWIRNLPKRTKLLSLSVLVLAFASAFSMYMSFKIHFLPQMGKEYLTGFADHASETYEYKDDDSKETFDSEIRHPEHMYEVEKIVVNLKGRANSAHLPMGLFEFYIELNSQEATVEMGDRKTETRHIIARVLEQLTYEELVSPQGKSKLKFIVRNELNNFLSKSHHVQQIYIKTFVLKP